MQLLSLSKKRMIRLAVTMAAFCLLTATTQAQGKIGTVDLRKVFEGYFKTKQADAQLQEHGAEAEKVLKGMLEEYQKGKEEYKTLIDGANNQAVSAEEREKRKKGAETKVAELAELEKSITQYRNEARARIEEQKRRLWDKIVGEIRERVNEKAKAGDFAMVLDTSTSGIDPTPTVLYSNGQYDLTQELLKELNAKAPAELLNTTSSEPKSPLSTTPLLDSAPAQPGSRIGTGNNRK